MASTHRPAGHDIAKGISVKAMMCEMFGAADGCCHCIGGAMHTGDISVGAMTANAIVGGNLPIAAGAAQLEEIQPITPPEQAREYLMLRMRTLRGIEEWEYRRKFGLNFEPIARRLEFFESHHWAEQSDHRWHFTPQGFLLSNTLILELLDAQSGTIQEQTYWKELIGQPDSDQDP